MFFSVLNGADFRDNTPWSFCLSSFRILRSFLPRNHGFFVFSCASVVVEAQCSFALQWVWTLWCSVASLWVSSRLLSCLSSPCSVRMSFQSGERLLCYAQWLVRVPGPLPSLCFWVLCQCDRTSFSVVCRGPLDARRSSSCTGEFSVVPWLRLRLQL